MADDPTHDQPGAPRQPIDPTGTSTPPPPPPGYVPAVYVQHPGSGKSAAKVVMYLLAVALLASITANVYLAGPVKIIANALAGGIQEMPYNQEADGVASDKRVVVVEISGTIEASMAEFARQTFYKLEQDPPAAVVLRVESGGGGVTASDQIWNAIKSFRAKHPDVPFVSSFGSVAASGGYYIAAPSDYIFNERTGITGSIGVLAQVPGLGGMVEKLGVEMNMVIATKSPNKDDANNLFIEWYDDEGNLTQEGKESVAVLKNLVNGAYETFFDVVESGRQAADASITTQALQQAATGAIFIGQEALDAKLVDEIGYLDDAIAHAAAQAKLTGTPGVTIIRQPVPSMLSSLLSGKEGANLADITGEDLRELVDDATAVKLEYRMQIR